MILRLQRIPPPDGTERLFLDLLASSAPTAPRGADAAAWGRVLALARAHALGGFLHRRRRDGDWWRAAPAWLREELRVASGRNALRRDLFLRELEGLLPALAAEGIEPVLLKGPALDLTVYGDPGERSFSDLDLLVGPADLERARALLVRRGYRIDEHRQPEEFYRLHHFHLVLTHGERRWARLELHWDLAVPAMDFDFPTLELRRRAVPVRLGGHDLRLPRPTDFLLHLCLHAATGSFSRLCQIRDVHAVATHPGWRIEPAGFWDLARRGRLVTAAATCLDLARLFGDDPRLTALREAGPPAPGARGLLRPETVLRQRLLDSAAGGLACALQRRDRLRDRLGLLGRRLRPRPDELGVQGLPYGREPEGLGRWFSARGLSLGLRATAYLLLARTGWEVRPAAGPHDRPDSILRAAPAPDAGRESRGGA